MNPLVSVIMPTFKQSQYIETSILGVMSQTYPNIELIIVPVEGDVETTSILDRLWIRYREKLRFYKSHKANIIHQINLGLKVAQGDYITQIASVPHYTPIIVKYRDTGLVDIKPISELATFLGNGRETVQLNNVDVFVGTKLGTWTKIKHVIRYPFSGMLYRILTHGGLVDVSSGHSLMLRNPGKGEATIRGSDVKVGMVLSYPSLYQRSSERGNRGFFFGNKDLAWFYGFFVAEGSISGRVVSIGNTKIKLLERCLEVTKRFFGREPSIYEDKHKKKEHHKTQFKLCIGRSKRLARFFKSKFYTVVKDKRVPIEIINAPRDIQLAFLDGYCAGDGSLTQKGRTWTFTTVSHTLAAGVLYLISRTTKQNWATMIRDNRVHVALTLPENRRIQYQPQKRVCGEVKKIVQIPYSGFLYDIATDSQVFVGGVGRIKLHNSDDFMLPGKIAGEVRLALEKNAVLVYSLFFYGDENLCLTGAPKLPEFSYETLVRRNYITDNSLVARAMFEEFGLFNEKLEILAVYDKWLHIAEKYPDRIFRHHIPTFIYRQHPNQAHKKRLEKQQQERFALYKKVVEASLRRKGITPRDVEFEITEA